LNEVSDSKPVAVLYYMNKREESASWNIPAQKEALSKINIQYAEILRQDYPVSSDACEKQKEVIKALLAKCE